MLPSSLLLLSRAFTLTQAPGGGGPPPDQGGSAAELDSLKNTLGALNKEVLDEVGLDVGQIGCGHARAHPGVTGPPACMPAAGRTDGRTGKKQGRPPPLAARRSPPGPAPRPAPLPLVLRA